MGRSLDFYFDTELKFSQPVAEHEFLLCCLPAEAPEQQIETQNLTLLPHCAVTSRGKDAFGNAYCAGRIEEKHEVFRYTLEGRGHRDDSLRKKSEAAPFYLYPSPLTQPTREIEEFFATLPQKDSPLATAQLFSARVHQHFTYVPGHTNVSTSAVEAFRLGIGVCQDYVHVLLALCRLAKIPARYVSGLPIGEGASHAWAEVWEDGLWYGLDPTRDCPADESYLKFCVGRDYSDCPLERGMFTGGADQTQTVFMKVTVV